MWGQPSSAVRRSDAPQLAGICSCGSRKRVEQAMALLQMFRELFAYNYWARDLQLQACEHLTVEQLERPLGNSFSSLRDTLVHMVGAEEIWLERLRGGSPARLPNPEELPDLKTITEHWQHVERGFRDYLAALSEEQLSWNITYTNFRREVWKYSLRLVLLHLVNHQSYHRGQVTTLLRQLGAKAPMVDLLVADDCGLFAGPGSTGMQHRLTFRQQ